MTDVFTQEGLFSAWKEFIETGRVDRSLVRKEIADSWERCRKYGLDPHAPKKPLKCSGDEFRVIERRNAQLLDSSLPFMQLLEVSVRGTGFIITLSDKNGIVIRVCGDEEILEMARENNYLPGCCRTEREVGTNSIALCLIEKKPVQVTGFEHYNVRHHSWTCSSAPIFSPQGELLGVITLSGKSVSVHRHTLGMVMCAAEAIENKLKKDLAYGEKEKLSLLLDSILNSISDAIVTVDPDGMITHVNRNTSKILGVPEEELIGKNVTSIFAGGSGIRDILDRSGDDFSVEVSMKKNKKVNNYYILRSYVIRGETNFPGKIFVLSEKDEVFRVVQKVSGYHAKFTFDDIKGRSPSLLRQIELAKMAARTDVKVLIMGESGTGKELFAQAIHNASSRRNGPFVAINCAAIPRELIEAELFGYREGAFTGAKKTGQIGKIELADGGTFFLDEIGQMPIDMQGKLLRVLQEGEFTRLGDTKPIKVNVRFIAATNRDLYEELKRGGFREDLYYRLSVVELNIPPLRERKEDIPILTDHILKRISRQLGVPGLRVSEDGMELLRDYEWPGNVRELENVLEMASIVSRDGIIRRDDFPSRLRKKERGRKVSSPDTMKIDEIERELLLSALRECEGNISEVSRKLGISRSTVYRKLKRIGVKKHARFEGLNETGV